MTSITGSTAPLHRRFNEQDSLRQIRNRYLGMKDEIADQVNALQRDERFLSRCGEFYTRGYKDWHILSAILNLMLQLRCRELKLNLNKREDAERMKKVPKELRGRVYPTESFLTNELDFMF